MDMSNILSGIIALGGIAGTVLGILGKQKYRRIIEAVIMGVEDAAQNSPAKNIKPAVRARAEYMGVGEEVHAEVKRITHR